MDEKKAFNRINLSAAAKFAEQYAKTPESSIRSALKATDLSKSEQLAFLHKDIEDQRNRYLGMFKATESMLESQKMYSSLHKNLEEAHSRYTNIHTPSDLEVVEKNFLENNSNLIRQQNEIQKEKQDKKERELRQLEIFEDMHNTQCQIIELARTTSSESAVERKRAHRITIASLIIAIVSLVITFASLIPPYFDFFKVEPKFVESDKAEIIELPPIQSQADSMELGVKSVNE